MSAHVVAVDHFAGTGWSVACRWLGIVDYGVEIMPEAIRTRRTVGFRTIYRDVWSGLLHAWLVPFHDLYIASPPCQTFSVAGRGTGRKALEIVLTLIASGAWKNPETLRAAGADLGDDRTVLVLTPLAHIWAHRPRLVALEQVPTVLPVWEAMAEVLRGLGYSVWTGNLQAEQYGVPQTRKRAILMARLDGPVAPPTPTHSRYYSRDPQRLDPGVQKWVSMAEALGWGTTDAVGFPRLADGRSGVMSIDGVEYRARDLRPASEPSFVVTEKGRSWSRFGADGTVSRVTADDAAALQTYPDVVYRNGNQANAARRPLSAPAPTIHFGARSNKVEWMPEEIAGDPHASGVRVTPGEAATLQSFPPIESRPELEAWRWFDAPATTIAGDPRITAREHHFHGQQSATSLKLEPAEAARFQTFPAPFPFQGSRGKQFLQIGNAVPPLLAYAILSALVAPPALVDVEPRESVVPAQPAVAEPITVSHGTADDFAESRARAVQKAEGAFVKAEERLARALEEYERAVAAHEKRGDGFFPEGYITARREAVLARKFQESKRAALATARAQMSAARLGDL